jgi:leucyl-tRNA synthetase
MVSSYNFKTVEKKWQARWDKAKAFKAIDNSKQKKYYVLEMLPYPSGKGLHVGHVRNYVIGDAFARYKRMRGFNILHPIGWDAFGLPSENTAIAKGIHPNKSIKENIENMQIRLRALGISYDWDREVSTHDPSYYKWDQWLFLKLMENGLVYKKKALGNWCPKCKTTLANEDVKAGKCWRCHAEVYQKEIDQWFVKITKYADQLLEGLDKIDWSNKLKSLQTNWIGKSKGTEIYFKESETNDTLKVFTTRPDTLFGVTFLVFAPEHPKVIEYVKGTKYEAPVKEFLKRTKKLSELDRISKEKDGLFIGRYAINPANGDKIPIYIGNFVVMGYGTGMIIAVPAHDQRDFEFAKKYDIPIKSVIEPLTKGDINIIIDDNDFSDVAKETRKIAHYNEDVSPEQKSYSIKKDRKRSLNRYLNKNILDQSSNFIIPFPHVQHIIEVTGAFIGEGTLINSKSFDGINNRAAFKKITDWLIKRKQGRYVTNYKIRDWNISRQRYWGSPIPIIYCKKCGAVPVPEKDLPVELPLNIKFDKKGAAPLATDKKFANVKCPACNGPGERETDTMTTFVDSAWYFLRYCDPHNSKKIFDPKKVNYWMPVDQYIGGIEHAVGHLMYSRFITKFLKKLGYLNFDEPFLKLLNQGMVNKGGVKMSKSKGNVVDPMDTIIKYGADTLRTYELFMAQPDSEIEWSDKDLLSIHKLIIRISQMHKLKQVHKKDYIDSITQTKIEKVTEHLDNLMMNKALIELMDFYNKIERTPSTYATKIFLQLMFPFAPHVCEETWSKLKCKGILATTSWPKVSKTRINNKAEEFEELMQKTSDDIQHICKIVGTKNPKKVCIYTIPPECAQYNSCKAVLHKKFGADVSVFAVNDRKKYDPYNKATKAKKGRPAIYLE